MGKKRKASGRQPTQAGPKDIDPTDARLGPINTFEDIADSEDEYWMKKDMIAFDDEPKPKRRKQWKQLEETLEDSEEEILGDEDSDDDSEDYASDLERLQASLKHKVKGRTLAPDEEAPMSDNDDDSDEGWHGAMRDEYYNADNIETEEAAIEEENEALRLQQKKLAKMSEADFAFDQDEWAIPTDDAPPKKVMTEVLKDFEISDDAGPEQRYQILRDRYPEFHILVSEFEEVQPKLLILQKEAEGKSSKSLEVIKYWTLGCYVAALASYFAILTSPARDDVGVAKTIDPEELREHEVMETLLSCQKQWSKVKKLRSTKKTQPESSYTPVLEQSIGVTEEAKAPKEPVVKQLSKKDSKKEKSALAKEKKEAAQKAKQAKVVQDSIADLSSLLNKPKKATKVDAPNAPTGDGDSDFGEEEIMDSKYAAEKAARKKSLRFYTSQIVQKSNKRAGASRNVGGDMDIPYRERLRDRQARLMAEAQKRGSKAGPGADLDDASSDGEAARNDSDDGYYDMITGAAQQKKAEKAAKFEAFAAASKRDLVVAQEEIGEDGKRKISYAIQKNKGLTPHRKKINRNPRVKKKKAYADKQKKWKTVRPTFQGAPKSGYQGELSGIKKGLVKVTKL
ncbi:uncharacterized protein MKZ38_002650 [Zalerion maritima]|uniref:Sas10 C-terminal domain-containing protein n=1 Tax=Zalerion maritima TaxID=339359 RepID=A0AAD5WXA4_9PEZI|nr:uncharacterized protein MKZ38_002650 [Zalerion maritima]